MDIMWELSSLQAGSSTVHLAFTETSAHTVSYDMLYYKLSYSICQYFCHLFIEKKC